MYRTITAKFESRCAATGAHITIGKEVVFDTETRKVYLPGMQPEIIPPLQTGDLADALKPERKTEWFEKIKAAAPGARTETGFMTGTDIILTCGCTENRKNTSLRKDNSRDFWNGKTPRVHERRRYTFCEKHATVNL